MFNPSEHPICLKFLLWQAGLEFYEQIVRDSKTMRLYRILKTDGIGGLMKKGIKKVGQNE